MLHAPELDETLQKLFHQPTEEDFIQRDHRTCDCELTYVRRKRHAALGTGIEIRLCCLAKKVEELAGLPPGTFFFSMDFEPSWEWDCTAPQKVEHQQPDGSVVTEMHQAGPPPRWLKERLEAKGIPIKNLGDE
jgi:hypothetical protein